MSRLRTSPPSSEYRVKPPPCSRTTGGCTAASPRQHLRMRHRVRMPMPFSFPAFRHDPRSMPRCLGKRRPPGRAGHWRAPSATFPVSPLKFRTSGSPGSGFKHQAPPQEFGYGPSATSATLEADPAMPVAASRVCAALRLDSATPCSGWQSSVGTGLRVPARPAAFAARARRPSLRTGRAVPPFTA